MRQDPGNSSAIRHPVALVVPAGPDSIVEYQDVTPPHSDSNSGRPHARLRASLCAITSPRAGSLSASYLSVRFLARYFTSRTLTPFAIYCLVVGLLAVVRFA